MHLFPNGIHPEGQSDDVLTDSVCVVLESASIYPPFGDLTEIE
jgi:hypothetical protein